MKEMKIGRRGVMELARTEKYTDREWQQNGHLPELEDPWGGNGWKRLGLVSERWTAIVKQNAASTTDWFGTDNDFI